MLPTCPLWVLGQGIATGQCALATPAIRPLCWGLYTQLHAVWGDPCTGESLGGGGAVSTHVEGPCAAGSPPCSLAGPRVALADSDTTGELGFKEFKYLWGNIKKWQCVYKQYDTDRSGTIGSSELPGTFEATGFRLNEQLYQMIVRRYSDENGHMDFDNFISCLVCLDAMVRKWLCHDGPLHAYIIQLMAIKMYSAWHQGCAHCCPLLAGIETAQLCFLAPSAANS
uniref:EF-hand domain-containing protein n=1 Tax=Gopherus evgoodei TaxID=1825980 RepID=A0A8C4VWZ5_9SAUR